MKQDTLAGHALSHDSDCPICVSGTFGIPGCLVLDALQVDAARKRWQWATLGAGANDCPCVQLKRLEAARHLQEQSNATD